MDLRHVLLQKESYRNTGEKGDRRENSHKKAQKRNSRDAPRILVLQNLGCVPGIPFHFCDFCAFLWLFSLLSPFSPYAAMSRLNETSLKRSERVRMPISIPFRTTGALLPFWASRMRSASVAVMSGSRT